MTQQQMIESIQQIYPDMGETQLRRLLNDALDEFVEETRLLTGSDLMVFNELITNGNFGTTSDGDIGHDNSDGTVDGYTNYALSGATSVASISSNKLKVIKPDSSPVINKGVAYTNPISVKANVPYTLSVDVDQSNGDLFAHILAKDSLVTSGVLLDTTEIVVGSSGAVETLTGTYTSTVDKSIYIYLLCTGNTTDSSEYILFDNFSFKPASNLTRYSPLDQFFNSINNDEDILGITRVDIEDKAISRFIGQSKVDTTDIT